MTDTNLYDLDKLHPDKLRLSKRKKLFKRTFAFTIMGLLIAFKLMSPTVFTAMAISAYNVKDSQKALRYLAPLQVLNIFEPYKYYLNSGDAKYQKADFAGAESQFRNAQKLVPKSNFCQITINLILSIEAQADALVAAKNYDKAIERYDEIKAIVLDSKCGNSDGEKTADYKSKEVEKRSSDKSDAAKKARNGDSTKKSASENAQEQKAEQLTKEQTEKLQKSEQNSSRLRQQSKQRKDSYDVDVSKRKYDGKNW